MYWHCWASEVNALNCMPDVVLMIIIMSMYCGLFGWLKLTRHIPKCNTETFISFRIIMSKADLEDMVRYHQVH